MKKFLSLTLSLLLAMTALTALPFSAAAASYSVNATTVESVASWEELNAALTDGKANKTIVLTKDISADPDGAMNGGYEWGTYDPDWGWQEEADHDCVITPNINGNVVIDLNGHDIQLGHPSYPNRYEVDNPRMFNLSSATGLYIINSQSTKGNVTISAKNTATLVYSNNNNASFHVVANASHPVTLTACDSQTGKSKGGASIVSVDPNSNGPSKCKNVEIIGADIVVDSYGGSVLNFSASTAMMTPVYIGGASFNFKRQYSHLVYTYDISYTYVTLFNASLNFGSESNTLFASLQSDSDKLAVSNILSEDYYSTFHSYYTLTGISATDDLFAKTIGKTTVIFALKGSPTGTVSDYLTSANIHYRVSSKYELTTTSEHAFEEISRKEPTCTEKGDIVRQCSECSAVFREEIAALGHIEAEPKQKVTLAPTCVAEGKYDSVVTCTRCGEELFVEKNIAIAATGVHNYDNGKVTKSATPTATGVKTYTCTVCGNSYDEAIPKLEKKANTLKAKAKKVTLKYSKLKKKNQTIAAKKAVTVSKAQGTVTYKLSSAKKGKKSFKKYFKVAKNGKITVKKGLKKGTYKVKIKVTAAGNASYKAATKTVTVKIKVK